MIHKWTEPLRGGVQRDGEHLDTQEGFHKQRVSPSEGGEQLWGVFSHRRRHADATIRHIMGGKKLKTSITETDSSSGSSVLLPCSPFYSLSTHCCLLKGFTRCWSDCSESPSRLKRCFLSLFWFVGYQWWNVTDYKYSITLLTFFFLPICNLLQ